MKKVILLYIVMTALFAGATVVHAQPLEEGQWFGQMMHPSGSYLDVMFNVHTTADSLQITLEVPSFRTFPLQNARLQGDELSFQWSVSVQLSCFTNRQQDGSFQGGCFDIWGGRGPLVMVPPSINPDSVEINEEVFFGDAAPPEPAKTRAELIAEAEVPPGMAVDVEGRMMNMFVQGEGDITVVLEAGLGDDLGIWNKMLPRVAKRTRVVAYDRAGLGYSDPSPSRRSPEQMATELHMVLRKAGIKPPYVLVGHAEGAFTIRRFASLYPDEVAGLVLVEPSHEALGARLEALDTAAWRNFVDQKKTFYAMLKGTSQAENEAFFKIMSEQEVPGVGPLPDVPLAVLTAMRPVKESRWVGETDEGMQAKFDLHKAWVDQAAHGTHYVTKTSGPYIHSEEPALVYKAIREVLEAVAAGRH